MTAPTKDQPRRRRAAKTSPERQAPTAAIIEAPSRSETLPENPPTTDSTRDSSDLESEIRQQAYELFLERGGADGDDVIDWLEAERIVRFRRNVR